jgi:glycosyltransferase involved in cell wall biosynthesis
MRFGMDAQRLGGQRLGVARYIEYLVKNWSSMLEPSDHFTLYLRDPIARESLPGSGSFELRTLRPRLSGQLWQNLVLPRSARSDDVLFCPSYSMPLGYRARCVLAIHSVNEVAEGTHPWWYRLRYMEIFRRSARRADRVIVPSHSTAADLQAAYDVPAERIETIWLGADAAFRPTNDETRAREVRTRYFGADRPFILFVGKLSQRRNIPVLLEALALLKARRDVPHGLLLVGPNHLGLPLDPLARKLGVADDVVQTDGRFDSHQQLVDIYNAADLFVHPSSYEGFCLPLVEALSCGVPVVTVNRSALGEIAADAALTIEEPAVEALADAMERAIFDEQLRAELRRKGPDRAESFRWPETARRTLSVLREVGGA